MPARFFNTAGPTVPGKHYAVEPLSRLDVEQVEALIEAERYFVLHAPRQTGKTTCLLALMERLNNAGRYHCVYTNIESAQAARSDVARGIEAVLASIATDASIEPRDTFPETIRQEVLRSAGPMAALRVLLTRWSESLDKPLVLFIDEVDALVGDTLVSVLRQLREGYRARPRSFPQSIVLCGIRDVRDYRIRSSGGEIITGGSAFNVKATSLRLGDFTADEVRDLLLQHTSDTGQRWTEEALDEIWRLTLGQPWLVNALGNEITFEMPEGRDRSRTIDLPMVTTARERLILRRDVHIDQLADKLKEPRVRRVIEPILASEELEEPLNEDDLQYVLDLGLVRRGPNGPEIANPIYREVLPRQLTAMTQLSLEPTQDPRWYVTRDGRLLFEKLMEAFQQFYRENSEHWVERFEYREAGPQLLLQAFLQRIVNGGGRVDREYGLGRMRTDLLVVWPHPGGEQKVVVEAKVVRRSRNATIEEGLVQARAYMDRCGTSDGHLVLFDARDGMSWDDRVFRDERDGIRIWGM